MDKADRDHDKCISQIMVCLFIYEGRLFGGGASALSTNVWIKQERKSSVWFGEQVL